MHDWTENVSWRQLARCRGMGPDVFYPDEDEDVAPEFSPRIAEAKQICLICPVREICLEHAISAREKFGIWGGLTAIERRRLIRRRRRSA